MNYVSAGQSPGSSKSRFPVGYRSVFFNPAVTLPLNLTAPLQGYCSSNATPVLEEFIGWVDDTVNRYAGNISLNDPELAFSRQRIGFHLLVGHHSAHRVTHTPSTDQMEMHVIDYLTPIVVRVEDQAVP